MIDGPTFSCPIRYNFNTITSFVVDTDTGILIAIEREKIEIAPLFKSVHRNNDIELLLPGNGGGRERERKKDRVGESGKYNVGEISTGEAS